VLSFATIDRSVGTTLAYNDTVGFLLDTGGELGGVAPPARLTLRLLESRSRCQSSGPIAPPRWAACVAAVTTTSLDVAALAQ
jgi:hypothetical protein